MEIRAFGWLADLVRVTLCLAIGLGVAVAASSGVAGFGTLGLLALILRELRSLGRPQ